jgi:hypothetical protein
LPSGVLAMIQQPSVLVPGPERSLTGLQLSSFCGGAWESADAMEAALKAVAQKSLRRRERRLAGCGMIPRVHRALRACAESGFD